MDYKKLFISTLCVCGLLLGTSAYYYLDHASQAEMIASLTQERDEAITQKTTAEENAKKLRGRLTLLSQSGASSAAGASDNLAKVIDEKDAEITRLKKQLEQAGNRQNDNRRGNGNRRENFQARMERMKQEDPERYEQMMSNMEKRRQEMEKRITQRDQYISNIDTSRLSYEQKNVVEQYKNLVQTQAEQRTAMQNGNGDFREMMETNRQVGQLSTQIRDILIEQYAGSSAEEIKNIINATSTGFGGGPGGFGGGPGGFGGGPGGFGGGQRGGR